MELLLVLPDGSKSLVPAAWTDAKASGADGEGVVATLAAWTTPPHSPLLVASTVVTLASVAITPSAASTAPCVLTAPTIADPVALNNPTYGPQ